MPVLAKLCIVLGLLGTIVGVAIFVSALLWSGSMETELEQIRAVQREAGEPVTLEELDAWYPQVPDAENAALLYEDIFTELEAIDPEGTRVEALRDATEEYEQIGDYPVEHREALKTFVADAEPALALLEAAVVRPKARFPIDLSEGMEAELPHLSKMRNAVRVLYLSSEAALLNGNKALAVERHATILPVGGALLAEPGLLPQLVRGAINGISFRALERLVNHTQFDEELLRQLDAAYAAAYHPEALQRALLGERCMAADTIRRVYDGTLNSDSGLFREIRDKLVSNPVLVGSYGRYEQLTVYAAFETMLPGVDPDWPTIATPLHDGAEPDTSGAILASILLPSISRAPIYFVRYIAYLRSARTAIAVERYRLAHGTAPDSLEDCVPEFLDVVPEDPYDGEAIRYQRESEGYVIYCVFDDLDDDGAVPWTRDDDRIVDGDLVFRVTR
ncbi:MAG: hypothetical protein L3K26_03460 [Candidatus Hydrogenedentes bacterium]|nr:hypothetical protein [Candidatus Hydrogenedentota bacterium]